ncbi:DUF3179 domain-containing protein [uncultured Winogradskyella sp.]|uniref:DUF3179 domain-containing protein n=1 Tax=uncultured Winogradskyella sp. TaxID=395353 RepID=UPI00260D9AEF|nr:DUF3179 domain-containing protein [uncultured Winogradskyella sp.]
MKNLQTLLITLFVLMLVGCSSTDSPNNDSGGGITGGNDDDGSAPSDPWSIPVGEVRDGGPGKDGIPSIDNPMFDIASSVNYLSDDELVVGIKIGDMVKAYPHFILDWHEIVNDDLDGTKTTLSYCPLTGTAFAWRSRANNTFSTFGVSGLLYNANLILYDRETDSNWSQILQECVNGELLGETPTKISVIETNWGTWKNSFPNSLVLNLETGFDKPYGSYPYGPYKTDHNFFIFVPSPINTALPNKERIFAIITENNRSKVYRFSNFIGGNAIRDSFFNTDYLIVGNENIIVAFKMSAAFDNLTFTYDFQDSEIFFADNEGNKWNMFGEAIEGPRLGQKLAPSKSVTSMWFAIAAFFPNPSIYIP